MSELQTFEATTRPEQGPPRLAALRGLMGREGLAGFLVPRADAHQGEYVAPCDERLAWLTGFTGSAGFAAILADRAGVFIDGRYRLQVRAQVAAEFTPVHWPETRLAGWLREMMPKGGKVGFDPWLHTLAELAELRDGLAGTGIELVESANLVDRIWSDRPGRPDAPVLARGLDLAGESSADKRARLGAKLAEAGHSAAVLTLPDSIAWLLNIRGSDIAHTPVVLANAILHADGAVDLFVAPGRLAELADHLGPQVRALEPERFANALAGLHGVVRVDKASAPYAVTSLLGAAGVAVAHAPDPCILPKARKNAAEIAHTAEAHLRDGAAMVEFLAWLDEEAPKGGLTEIGVVRRLEHFRRATNALQDISFDTICGAGANGAIVHYRVTRDSDRPLRPGELLLVDSGGQYLDGTTDITRTIAIGEVGQVEKQAFTRVLQGMIAISRLRFPKGISGAHVDSFARAPLWLAGQDYDHGTGHGVGAYLSVHEGPARISRLADPSVALEPGMILSNEPGYYREGAFGIRIENLIVVQPAEDIAGADAREMFSFRTLTFVPIDRRLILPEMLSAPERDWLNRYHAEVAARIGPRVSGAVAQWLAAATAPL